MSSSRHGSSFGGDGTEGRQLVRIAMGMIKAMLEIGRGGNVR